MLRKKKIATVTALAMMLMMMCTTVPASAAATDKAATPDNPRIEFTSFSTDAGSDKETFGKNRVVVTDVEYDREDREVTFEFRGSVQWRSPKVKITKNGNNYFRYIIEKDNDDLEVKVKKLTYGSTYSYKITGVKNKRGTKYQTVTGTFRAVGD